MNRSQVRSSARTSALHGAAALAVLLLAATSARAGSSTEWAPNAPRDHRYAKVLVVGISTSVDNRCNYENFLADQLQSKTVEVIQSCDLEDSPVQPPTRASVAEMAKDSGADAVLTTRFVGANAAVQNDGSRDDRGGYYFKAYGTADMPDAWGFYDLPVTYGDYQNEPALNLLEGNVMVVSQVYSVQDSALVCTIKTTVKDVDTSENAIAAVAEAVADRMRSDGIAK
ncbi:MAG: hypothetical protein U1F09_14250 [Steroidobacteraceae bacterium]